MRIHFIGIGGIGVSALARYYLAKGHSVSGSDLTDTEITQALQKQGAKIKIGPHKAENIPLKVDLVVYSPAVQRSNPELQYARNILSSKPIKSRWRAFGEPKQQMNVLSYPEALGEITQQHYTIAVSGTHGKSTTTAMIGLLLIEAGFDPTVIVGTKVKEFDPNLPSGTNCRVGQETFLIKGRSVLLIEADEHFASFLNYSPDVVVLTTVEPDHLDFYKNLNNIIKAFKEYVHLLPADGIIVANKDDRNVTKIAEHSKRLIHYYSGDWDAADELRKILKVPGEFNVANAHAALTLARALGIPDSTSFKALGKFRGTWRRFETFAATIANAGGKKAEYTLVSDYGHHPTEVKVTVQTARLLWPTAPLWLVFQPHQYQRTFYFFRDFISIFAMLPTDKMIITDIYDVAGREETAMKEKVSSEQLVKQIIRKKGRKANANVLYIPTIEEVETHLKENLQGGEVVMVMGAGDIYNLTLALTKSS